MPKPTPLETLAEITRLSNVYRREAIEQWQLRSPFRQSLYIKARLSGKTPDEAIRCSRGNLRKEGVEGA